MTFYSRKPTRISEYDYSRPNYYFITVCTHEKQCIFGTVQKRNAWGQIAYEEMEKTESHYSSVRVDNFIVMSNHIHAIIAIEEKDGASLHQIVGSYKSGVTRRIRQEQPEAKIWQRSFHDRVIRSQKEYEQIWQYVQHNGQKWEQDCFYPKKEET